MSKKAGGSNSHARKMKTDKHWWKHFFNQIYLITDARSVLNPALTRKEVDLLEKALTLNKKDKILDLCGGHGRHSLELARRGYRNLTVLDFSNHLIKLGKKEAQKDGFNIKFLQKDARFTGLKNNDYSVIFVMANSFGYFPDERQNLYLLTEMYRLLQKSGRLLLDLTDAKYAKRHLKPVSWHEANQDVIVCRYRELDGSLIKAREIVLSKKKGLLRDGLYCERLYDKNRITQLLKTAGFKNLSIKQDLFLHKTKTDYGFMTSRMIATAVKP